MTDRDARYDDDELIVDEFIYEDDPAMTDQEDYLPSETTLDDSYANTGTEGDSASDKASDAKNAVKDKANDAKHKAEDVADTLKQKAKDLPSADELKVQGGEALDQAKEKLGDAAHVAEEKADVGINKTAGVMASAADTLHQQGAQRDDQLGAVAEQAAEKMDTASDYLRNRSAQDILDDVEALVREKPLESVLVAAGVGLLLSRVFS